MSRSRLVAPELVGQQRVDAVAAARITMLAGNNSPSCIARRGHKGGSEPMSAPDMGHRQWKLF
jgi:hypothetical protein